MDIGDAQDWYWTPEWQAGEHEAGEDIAEGRVTVVDPAEDMGAEADDAG